MERTWEGGVGGSRGAIDSDGCISAAKDIAAVARGPLLVFYRFWSFRAQDIHAGHVWSAGARPSQSRQSLGKLPAASSDMVAMVASQSLVMGRLARAAFF